MRDAVHALDQNFALPASTALAFKTVVKFSPREPLAMQAALQPFVDNAISKTITMPTGFAFKQFCTLYPDAYHLGLKGCTIFRPNPVTGAVLLQPAETVILETACCARPERGS